jgi:hypothetical protein
MIPVTNVALQQQAALPAYRPRLLDVVMFDDEVENCDVRAFTDTGDGNRLTDA